MPCNEHSYLTENTILGPIEAAWSSEYDPPLYQGQEKVHVDEIGLLCVKKTHAISWGVGFGVGLGVGLCVGFCVEISLDKE